MSKEKDKLKKLLEWANESKEIFEKSGETDFEELKPREKKELLKELLKGGYNYGSIMYYRICNLRNL